MKSLPVVHALADDIDSRVLAGSNVIAGIQEPNYNPESRTIARFKSSNLIYFRGQAKYVRAALYSNNILQPFPQFINADVATARWVTAAESKYNEIIVTSVYMPTYKDEREDGKLVPYGPVYPPLFKKLVRYCTRKSIPLIILTDSNCHSCLWGHPDTNPRGKHLEQLLLRHDLVVHNIGELPDTYTWYRNDQKSIIDLTITSAILYDDIINWHITDINPFGDHRCIEFEVKYASPPCTYYRNLKKGNWSRFVSIIDDHNFPETTTYTPLTLEKAAIAFTKLITDALDVTHPLQKRIHTSNMPAWYDEETDKAKKDVKKAHDKWRRKRTVLMHMLLQDARRTYRRLLFKKRKRSWKHFVNNHASFKDVAAFKKILNRQQLNELGSLKKGDKILNAKESLNHLAEEHFPDCKPIPNVTILPSNTTSCDINDDSVEFISAEKVHKAINSFGDYKAPGPDGIKQLVLKKLPAKAIQYLTNLYRASILLAYTPTNWRESSVIFIPKQDKDDYAEARSFRPISLLPTIMRTFERVVLWQMQETTLARTPLHTNQHAFRKGRSTDSALTNTVEYIEAAYKKGHVTLGVFVDIKGAFDTVTKNAIISGLRKRGENPLIIHWYEHFLTNRTIKIEHKGNVTNKLLTRGTPQGGVLSPIMWNIAFDSLLYQFPDKPTINMVGFADDGALLVTAKSELIAARRAQTALDKIVAWGDKNSLTFAPTKTKAVFFHRRKTLETDDIVPLYIKDEPIEYVEETKYLGVILDQKLTWQSHLANKIKKAKKLLFKVRRAAGKLWGLNPKMSIWFYRAIVRPMISYGSIVWMRILNSKAVRKKLASLQRLALMSMGHFRKSTPTAGLEIITYTTPLWLHIMQEGCMAYLRTMNLTKLPREKFTPRNPKSALNTHRKYAADFLSKIEYEHANSDDILPIHNWEKNFHLETHSFEEGEPTDTNDDLTIYTDGSQDAAGNVGAGFVVYHQNIEQKTDASYLGKHLSVFQGEVYAIYKSVNHLLNEGVTQRHITIHSDSKSALLAINSSEVKSTQVHNTIISLNELAQDNIVELRWIKAHVGHFGNETADTLAKEGALDPSLQANDTPLITNHTLRKELRMRIATYWSQVWDMDEPCRQTKLFFPYANKKLSNNITKCRRSVFSAVVQLITGHNFLARHECIVEYGKVIAVLAECQYCHNGEESSFHLIAECDAFAAARMAIWGVDTLTPPFTYLKNTDIVAFLRETKSEAFISILNYELQ